MAIIIIFQEHCGREILCLPPVSLPLSLRVSSIFLFALSSTRYDNSGSVIPLLFFPSGILGENALHSMVHFFHGGV